MTEMHRHGSAAVTGAILVLLTVLLVACGGGSDSPTGVAMAVADASLDETDAGTANLTFTVTLAASDPAAITVDFSTTAGTAGSNTDFTVASGTVTFPPGTTSQIVTVPVVGDLLDEDDEEFRLTLANLAGNAHLQDSSARGTIRDNDAPPALSIADVQSVEGNAGISSMTFTVTLSAPSGRNVSASFATVNGTATGGSDFVAASGTASFTAGQTSLPVIISVNADTAVEADEAFTVALSSPTNATLADSIATGILINDDTAGSAVFGLDARPSNTTCLAPPRPSGNASVGTADAFPAAPAFSAPTKILQAPGDASRWFVLEKTGRLKVFSTASPASVATWLDFSGVVNAAGEGGLLGLAFHPDWPATREVFVSYTAGSPMVSRLSRIILDSVTTPSTTTEQILLTVNQSPFDNHKGGDIDFGPDGFLYVGLGDGGSSGDPNDNAQNQTRLLGKMLRIDVAGVAFPSPGYTIPGDNPSAANPKCGPGSNGQACPETYASGLRNPWRWSFDPPTGDLWAGDVGQGTWEEVDRIEKGGNYGWRCREGAHPFNANGCPAGGFVEPVTEYSHADGNTSITGGYVYRGAAIPVLQGRYVFGDFTSGRIWALEDDGQGGYSNDELVNSPYNISAFATGEDGELYFADYGNGRIRKIIAASGGGGAIPTSLADTGCMAAGTPTAPASGLIPYGVSAPFWSDGADKERYMAIPDGAHLALTSGGHFDLPNGSVLVKSFRLNGQLIETRLLMRHPDGVWAGYTYEWNAAQTAATRVTGGKARQVSGQTWLYPSEAECMQCHTTAAGFSLGTATAQSNGPFTYPSTGRTANQLETLDHIGLFTTGLPAPVASLPALTNPADGGASVTSRARAYLHTNCAQCHRPGGPTPSSMDLRSTTALSATGACDAIPQEGALGIANARLISPGAASRSIVVVRMNRRDSAAMPPIGSSVLDAGGSELVGTWIDSLAGCQ